MAHTKDTQESLVETTRQLTGLWPCGTVTRMDKVPLETTKKEATEVGNKVMWAHLCTNAEDGCGVLTETVLHLAGRPPKDWHTPSNL